MNVTDLFNNKPEAEFKQGITEARVGNRMSDMEVGNPKIVYSNGRAVGEIGLDHEPSPGQGPYYMKHYDTNTWYSGYDTKKEALVDLKHCLEQMNEGGAPIDHEHYRKQQERQTRAKQKQGVAEQSPLDRTRDHLGAQGYIGTQQDRLRNQERHQAWLDRHHQSMLSQLDRHDAIDDAYAQSRIDSWNNFNDRHGGNSERQQRRDDDWQDTFDMMRDRINRYQWGTQRDVDPEQLAAISNITYTPRRERNKDVEENIDAMAPMPEFHKGDEILWRPKLAKMVPVPVTVVAVAPGKIKIKLQSPQLIQTYGGKDTIVVRVADSDIMPKSGVAEGRRKANTQSARAELGKRKRKEDPAQQDAKNKESDEAWERLQQHIANKKQGVAEGAGNIGKQIKALYRKIYNQGDDAIEFMYYDSPVFAQYWDEYEGDLGSIIAEVDPKELQVIYSELLSAAENEGLVETRRMDSYDRDVYSSQQGFDRPADHRGLRQELAHERNNLQISINGRPWKVIPGRGYADSAEERSYLNSMKSWAERKSAQTGKKWTVYLTGAEVSESQKKSELDEVSNELLGRYKKAASAASSAADKAGDYEKGHKRYKGIIKATKKQFDNDLKKHNQNEGAYDQYDLGTDPDDYEDQNEGFYVCIGSEDDGGFIGMVVKDGGKWRETKVAGNAPHNWGTGYMGYLTPEEVMQWIRKDYGRYAEVEGPFDDEESAREHAQMQYGLDEGEVVQFPKKHRSDLDGFNDCPKCGRELEGGTYMGRRVKVCQPCKQVYLPPNSGIDQQGNEVEEGVGKDIATLGGIATLGIAGGLAGNYADQQQPKVEIGGKVAFVEPAHSRVPDSAMTLTGKDGKTYRVWATRGTAQSPQRYHAVPVEGVKEAQSMGDALRNSLSRAEPGSKLDKKIRHHNDMVRRGGQGTMTSTPDGYYMDKKGMIRLGQGVAEGSGQVEAYGYAYNNRDQRVMWRKIFPSSEAAYAWADKKNATVLGVRPVEQTVKEESSTSSEAAESAITRRIMVAHTDLLRQYGPQKVLQAIEEVAYNVGDLDEIGTSDVSIWVNQVKQLLGAA